MRMRKKKNLAPRMAACQDYLISEPQALKGKWQARSGGRPLNLEIGCGKGRFITQLALQNPDRFFVAVERVPSVLLLALEKAKALALTNLVFIQQDAALLADVFGTAEVAALYLNFSDPWPPAKHHKRRLSHPRQLAVYDTFLAPGAQVIMKTDNQGLFQFSLCQFSQFGYPLTDVQLDLHASGECNITTEYEESFASQGMKIYRLIARKPGGDGLALE